MGMLDDIGRMLDASKDLPKPKLGESLSKGADAVEQARGYQKSLAEAEAALAATGAPSANPFVNAGVYNSAVAGMGAITALVDTGTKFEGATIYDVSLTVTIDGRDPYDVVHRQLIASAALNNWQVGKTISVRIDPHDQTKVMLG